jgi:hypothetical protein
MIDNEIKETLLNIESKLNFEGLLSWMESNGVPYKSRGLRGPMGFAAFDGVYLDLDTILNYNPSLLFFVILHETAHYKRIIRMGKDNVIKFLSYEDFDMFFDHVVTEEVIADRYGRLVYRLMNGVDFPIHATQQLENEYRRERYKSTARVLFGKINNSEENYNELVKSFIIDED